MQCSTTYIMSHLHPSVPRLGRSTRRVALLPRTLVSLSSPHASRPLCGGACSGPIPLAASDHHRMAHAMDSPESRLAFLLIRGACARYDGLPGSLSGTSFAEDSGSTGDCQTFLRPRARGPHACLLLRWGGTGKVES